jgi:hypothetical protein
MSNRKNYNSIVFLTTLSVYLGLVLVGAPPVLAQAALTQKIEIQNEAEIKDDLDKKPNDKDLVEDIEIIKNFKIADAITDFFDDLKKLESIGKFDFKKDFNFTHDVLIKQSDSEHSETSGEAENPWVLPAIKQLISLTTISDSVSKCGEGFCKKTKIEVEANSNEFLLSFKFTKSNSETAKLYAEALNKLFVSQKLEAKDSVKNSIYENTKATFENNQIFIVTRLPRASIDEHLAQKDAQ